MDQNNVILSDNNEDVMSIDAAESNGVLEQGAAPEADVEFEDFETEEDMPGSGIDNTGVEYTGEELCIQLNMSTRSRKKLEKDFKKLCGKYPNIKALYGSDELRKLEIITDKVFPFGFTTEAYIRNVSFTNSDGDDVSYLAIRPRVTEYHYLKELLGEGRTLLFKGHLPYDSTQQIFFIDEIYDVPDTKQLDFESVCSFRRISDPWSISSIRGLVSRRLSRSRSFLFDVLEQTKSLVKFTEERLTEWEEYLEWKEQLARCQSKGIKYFRRELDPDRKRLIFWLVCANKKEFDEFGRFLKKEDLQVMGNDYSAGKWEFELPESDQRQGYSDRVELGRFRGIAEQYTLNKKDLFLEEDEEDDGEYEEYEDDEDEEYDDSGLDEESEEDEADDENEKAGEPEEGAAETPLESDGIPEINLFEYFEQPYIVKVEYDLNKEDKLNMEEIELENGSGAGMEYLRGVVLPQYYPDGFLALSAAGDFALVRRFRRAISDLKRNYGSNSPNLALWLFNIRQARLPDENDKVVIDKWLNESIANNVNQRTAVEKMLAAPDVCLIQGPPGTGKTTVIAEGIYQFIRLGYRVLIASQSNDAVDNALERLADVPEIRAIRLGQKSQKKKDRKIKTEPNPYSEEKVLKHYYTTISKYISDTFLEKWNSAERVLEECSADEEKVNNYSDDIANSKRRRGELTARRDELIQQEQALLNQLREIDGRNASVNNEEAQLHVFESVFDEKPDISAVSFCFSKEQMEIVENIINPVIAKARGEGVYLTPEERLSEEQGASNECEYLRILIDRTDMLSRLVERAAGRAVLDRQDQSAMEVLQIKLEDIKNLMVNAVTEERMDEAGILRGQLNEVKDEIERLGRGQVFAVSATEKKMLSDELYNEMLSGLSADSRQRLADLHDESRNALEKLRRELNERAASLQVTDTASLSEELGAVRGKLETMLSEIAGFNDDILGKWREIQKTAEKYGASAIIPEDIFDTDTARDDVLLAVGLKRLETEEARDAEKLSIDWKPVMEGFCGHLEDESAWKYDGRFFMKTYIESCNVVGISCTDNMRELSDYGLDQFDVVIIDEVSKATPPELLIPLLKAEKAVIVGDHRQLPPMFKEHEGSFKDMIADKENTPEELKAQLTKENFAKFKNMVTASLFKKHFEEADDSIKHSLLTQYRMHSNITDVINRFYENRLQNGLSAEEEQVSKAHGMEISGADGGRFIVPDTHAYWIDSSALPSGRELYDSKSNRKTANSGGTSIYNTLEKWIVIELLKMLADGWRENYLENGRPKKVGVISFYQAQVNQIWDEYKKQRKKFDFSPLEIEINTVDRFQGKEKNIVITSLVRNKYMGRDKGSGNPVRISGHVLSFERINVAFSRAQEMLLIVGAGNLYANLDVSLPNMDRSGAAPSRVYFNIMEELRRKGALKGSEAVISPETERIIVNEYDKGDD